MRDAGENASRHFRIGRSGSIIAKTFTRRSRRSPTPIRNLTGEDEKLFKETMRDYRRAGLDLPPEKRKEVEKLRKQLSKLGHRFRHQHRQRQRPGRFHQSRARRGAGQFFASPGVKTGDDAYTVMANVTWQFITVEENAKSEATRKKLYVVHDSLGEGHERAGAESDAGVAQQDRAPARLQIVGRFSDRNQNGQDRRRRENIHQRSDQPASQPKFAAEVAELQKMKAAETEGSRTRRINVWDWRYYQNQLNKQKYTVDKEALRDFFPFQKVLDGMFDIYQNIFGLKFEQDHRAIQMGRRSPALRGERRGHGRAARACFISTCFRAKENSITSREFEIIGGKLLPDGKYQRPTVALLCNFPPPSADKPSLMTHTDVETLFHEFGHALHSIVDAREIWPLLPARMCPAISSKRLRKCCRTGSGTRTVLDTFAADYRDPSKKIPAETIQKMNDAKLATAGVFYRRQFAFASLDLAMHDQHPENAPYDCVAISNPILEKVFLPIDPSTTFVTYFGHLERLRCRLLWLRLGGCDRGRHGDGFRESARTVISIKQAGNAVAP